MTKLALVDIDDTILQYNPPFRIWMDERGYKPVRPFGEVYDLAAIYGVDADHAIKLVEEFTFSEPFGQLEPEPCAKEVLPKLKEAGYRFVAITATVKTEENRLRRLQNLHNAFGFEFEDLFCTGLRMPKTPYLEAYKGQSDLWVEDNFGHAVDGAEIGHNTFVLTRLYNQGMEHPLVKRVNTWHEIAETLL